MRGWSLTAAGLAVLLAGCGGPAPQGADHAEAPPPAPTSAEKAATFASLPAPYDTADLAAGEAKFAICRSCHTITPGGARLTGPNLYGVFGRKAGSVPDFAYSAALKSAGFNWDLHHLDSWLANPATYMPGTKMSFRGYDDAKDRIDVIAYLAVETGYKSPGEAARLASDSPKKQP